MEGLEQSTEGSAHPKRKTRRAIALAGVAVLVTLGGGALAMGLYVSKQSEGFDLTLSYGRHVTRVTGTNVVLQDAGKESHCVLSLMDFRGVRERSLFLTEVTGSAKPGAPTFTIATGDVVNSGALSRDQLDPIDSFVLQRASACITQP